MLEGASRPCRGAGAFLGSKRSWSRLDEGTIYVACTLQQTWKWTTNYLWPKAIEPATTRVAVGGLVNHLSSSQSQVLHSPARKISTSKIIEHISWKEVIPSAAAFFSFDKHQ